MVNVGSRDASRAICVLGMHRSGTSVVSRAVNLLGAYLGEEEALLPPVPDNQEGVFERLDVVDLHDRILRALSRTWHSVGPLPEGWEKRENIRLFHDELKQLVAEHFAQRPVWAWKDPRTTLLLPLWKSVLAKMGIPLSCVYVVRNPLDVAKSLKARDGFPFEKSWGLWLTANLAAIRSAGDVPTMVVSYDRVLADWEREVRRCTAALDMPWPLDDLPLRTEMAKFLRTDLRHSRSEASDLAAAGAPQSVVDLYHVLRDAAGRDSRMLDHEVLATVDRLYQPFSEAATYLQFDSDEMARKRSQMATQIAELRAEVKEREEELGRIHRSVAWRALSRVRRLVRAAVPVDTKRGRAYWLFDAWLRVVMAEGWSRGLQVAKDGIGKKYWPYQVWISREEVGSPSHAALVEEVRRCAYRPTISIVTPVYNPSRHALTECIQSVVNQGYEKWELCLVDGGSSFPHVKEVIEEWAGRDKRITYRVLERNLGIAGNSNEALKLATGEYVAFLDHDDTLAPFALEAVVRSLNRDPAVEVLYSDEDKISSKGTRRYAPQFKSDWAPDTFRSYNYLCHFLVVRRSLIDAVGAFRNGFDGAQDYDLILRLAERTNAIRHIPRVLYHWRAGRASTASNEVGKPYASEAAKKAIAEHLARTGLGGEVVDGIVLGAYRVRYRRPDDARVCLIIPTRDKVDLVQRCVESVLEKTGYSGYTVLIVDNQSVEPATLKFFNRVRRDPRVRIVRYDHPFNFAALNNWAVRQTDAEYLVFLNNDTEVMDGEWLGAMLEFAQRADVGAVGAKLYYPDRTIQHAGTIIGYGGLVDHAHQRFPRTSHGYMGRINIIQNLSAVTAACLMMRKAVFDEVGGLDERLSHSFNDVDLCLKLRARGYLIVYTPYAALSHHESASRGRDEQPDAKARLLKEVDLMKTRWKHVLDAGDPYYNPNLTLDQTDFGIRL